jgi:N-acetylmuramoyl-L-alanine amidase
MSFWKKPGKGKVAICVGHSRKINGRLDGGAVSVGGISEHAFNSLLASAIESELADMGHDVRVWKQYGGSGYSGAMRWLGGEIREWGADCAIELHFNSASPSARGHEWLYWDGSKKGKKLSDLIRGEYAATYPDFPDRGSKPVNMTSRGGGFCRYTHCPAVIAEPFFGSNERDWKVANTTKASIASAIADGIDYWLAGQK